MIKRLLLRSGLYLMFFLVLVLQLVSSLNQTNNVNTEVEIQNSPPYFLKSIPNQSWASNTYLINAFDLDDYFEDIGGLALNYSYSRVQNITLDIDSSNNVSFYPDFGFIGVRNLTFSASNGRFNTSSNMVYLNVGIDNEPPQWSSLSKSKAPIYQNSYVNFSASWADNVGLKKYVFSINQGSWVNYTGEFLGLQNISRYKPQISAPSGSVVQWMFCAYDSSDNLNCTDIQNFSVSNRPSPPSSSPTPASSPGGNEGGFFSILTEKKTRKFSVNTDSFKVSLKQGETETKVLEITNTGNTNLSINLSINGLEKFVTLSEYNFTLLPGERKRITVDFSAFKSAFPGQYFGELVVASSEILKIPLIIDINLLDFEFEVKVSVLEGYKQVRPGNRVKANLNIKSIKDTPATNLTLYIALKDLSGNIYDSFQEALLFSSSLDLEKNLSIPADVREGEYIFYARISNDNSIAIDSDFFEVGSRIMFAAFLKSSFVFILIIVLSVFAVILVSKYNHEKEKERVLNLYVMLNELKKLMKEDKFDEAVELYIKIKEVYKEPVSNSVLENKEKLKEEISRLANKLESEKKEIGKEVENPASGEDKQEKEDEGTEEKQEKEDEKKEVKDLDNKNKKMLVKKNAAGKIKEDLKSNLISDKKSLKKDNTNKTSHLKKNLNKSKINKNLKISQIKDN